MPTPYAELHCVSNFSFLRGASHPEELVRRAAELGYEALAVTDECSVAGVVRAHEAAREVGLHLIVGAEFRLVDGVRFVVLAPDRAGYARLCALITTGRRAAEKGDYRLTRGDVEANGLAGCPVLWLPGDDPEPGAWCAHVFGDRCRLAVELLAEGDDRARMERFAEWGRELGLACVAAGDVHMHVRGRRALQDTVTAIRHNTTVAEAGYALFPNGERHLRDRERLARIYPEAWLRESARIAGFCRFSLSELRYEYPGELVPDGETPASWLRRLTERGAENRWPDGVPGKVRKQLEHELGLIHEMGYEPYFLTVHDVVAYARRRNILCQGRGSAANSAVCFCLGVTEVDPARMDMLFERFVSKDRDEPPDIDVDFEHQRREEVIQYVYEKYGRARAALAATVISYRPRSAVRDVGRALGLDPLQLDRLANAFQWWDPKEIRGARLREAGFDPDHPVMHRLGVLVDQLIGFPRHLSQHVGGFVISQGPLSELVPVENAAMDKRTVIQWDKDDLESLGLLKVDVLSLGMLTAIRRAFDRVRDFRGRELTMATVPAEDPEVYRMIRRADTMGVFQIESRAQMAMLPRLRPQCFYDLVIEVAIVRPGPIQGDMVHPYLARRNGEAEVEYPGEEIRRVLHRTLGVPIFQEQAMQLAVVAAGFTPGEADRLRRSMAAWKRRGGLEPFRERLIEGMLERGYAPEYAEQIYNQLKGFGEYGFPESHSASFALLVYVSAWLKCHEPAAFACALLNSQPMGFYAPAQLVRDAREHDVAVRPVDVRCSETECTLERGDDGEPVLRLGLNMVSGLSGEAAERLVAAREAAPLEHTEELAGRARLARRDLEALASAGALRGLAGHRYRARWEVAGTERPDGLFDCFRFHEATPLLARPTEGQDIVADYGSVGLTLERHPLALLRERLAGEGMITAEELRAMPDGEPAFTGGLVINRQRPGSAKGVTFMTLEDETGYINIVVWQKLAERQRKPLLNAMLLGVRGTVQKQGDVVHLIAARLEDHSRLLGNLTVSSRDFR